MTASNIGIFGGGFDPVHRAHIKIAREFVSACSLDLLYVIPNKSVPKKQICIASGEDRINMLRLAFSGDNKVRVSDIELKRDGMSFTCDTVAELKKAHPDSKLFLLVGEDWLTRIADWKNADYVFENTQPVVARRTEKDITQEVLRLAEVSGRAPIILSNDTTEISSTMFRDSLDEGLIPKEVFKYIKERGLYGL